MHRNSRGGPLLILKQIFDRSCSVPTIPCHKKMKTSKTFVLNDYQYHVCNGIRGCKEMYFVVAESLVLKRFELLQNIYILYAKR